jgi:signal transduction histidine kinase
MRQYLNIRTYLVIFALFIAGLALFYFTHIVKEMETEERKRVELVVEAIETLGNDELTPNGTNITYISKVIDYNTSIPFIVTDKHGEILSYINLDEEKIQSRHNYLANKLQLYKEQNHIIHLRNGNIEQLVYYGDSHILADLRYYPFILIVIIFVFVFILYIVISNVQKNIQNQLWVGMSKETAHQLGTPLTSIMGWIEVMKSHEENKPWLDEMDKDVSRLQLIADRFSKIGSAPKLEDIDLVALLREMVDYMQKRSPIKVSIDFDHNVAQSEMLLSAPLFNWVIENLIRNALDAMEGRGEIHINLFDEDRRVLIDVSDSGKGIPKSQWKKIFTPGFSTKKRGWGLGLSLAKRIVTEFHEGEIFVKQSEMGKGTTFRIVLRR